MIQTHADFRDSLQLCRISAYQGSYSTERSEPSRINGHSNSQAIEDGAMTGSLLLTINCRVRGLLSSSITMLLAVQPD